MIKCTDICFIKEKLHFMAVKSYCITRNIYLIVSSSWYFASELFLLVTEVAFNTLIGYLSEVHILKLPKFQFNWYMRQNVTILISNQGHWRLKIYFCMWNYVELYLGYIKKISTIIKLSYLKGLFYTKNFIIDNKTSTLCLKNNKKTKINVYPTSFISYFKNWNFIYKNLYLKFYDRKSPPPTHTHTSSF